MIEKLMIEIAPAPVRPVTKPRPDIRPVRKPEKGSPFDVPAPKVNPTPKGFL